MNSDSEFEEIINRMAKVEKVGVAKWLTGRIMGSRNAKALIFRFTLKLHGNALR